MRGRHRTGKGDRVITAISEPPHAKIELGHRRGIEKRQLVQIGQGVDNVVIRRIDDANFVYVMPKSERQIRCI